MTQELPQQSEVWPPPPVGVDSRAVRAPFFHQNGASKAVKVMAVLLALLWLWECALRWQSFTPTVVLLTWIYDITSITATVVMTILFLRWVYFVEKNRKALGRPAYSYTPGWAVGYFLIPIVSLYKPYKNMIETWNTSNPFLIPHERDTWAKENPTTIISVWWAFVLISNLASFMDGFNVQHAMRQGFAQYHATAPFAMIAVALDIVSLFIACRMIDAVNARQNKAHHLKESALDAVFIDSPRH